MKKICLLAAIVLLAGCVGSGAKTPVEEPRPYPVDSTWLLEEVCKGGIVLKWSDGNITYDKIPQKMMCPPGA